MADLTLVGKNIQKKKCSSFASEAITLTDATDDTLFVLPKASLITAVYAVVTTADTSGTVDVKVGSTVVANEIDCTSAGVAKDSSFAASYHATGGTVTVVEGATGLTGDGVIRIVVEYIECDATTGEYTV